MSYKIQEKIVLIRRARGCNQARVSPSPWPHESHWLPWNGLVYWDTWATAKNNTITTNNAVYYTDIHMNSTEPGSERPSPPWQHGAIVTANQFDSVLVSPGSWCVLFGHDTWHIGPKNWLKRAHTHCLSGMCVSVTLCVCAAFLWKYRKCVGFIIR